MSVDERVASASARRLPLGITSVVAVVVVAVGAVLAWRALDSGSPSVPAASVVSGPLASGSSGAGRAAAGSGGSAVALGPELATVALQPTDLQNGFHTRLVPAGDQVAGQVTLDNCGYRFTTEAHRVARRQYEVLDANDRDAGLSNEVVAYDTPTNAMLALRQWHQASMSCPNHPVTSPNAGVVRLTEHVTHDEVGSPSLPVATNVVTAESISTPSIGTTYLITVIQVHGRILDAIYAQQRAQPADADIRGAETLAAATGRHLSGTS